MAPSTSGSSARAADWNTATRTVPVTVLSDAARSDSVRSRTSSSSVVRATRISACGVSWTRRPAFESRATPASFSSAESCWETAEGLKFRAAATSARVPRSASSRSSRSLRTSSIPPPPKD